MVEHDGCRGQPPITRARDQLAHGDLRGGLDEDITGKAGVRPVVNRLVRQLGAAADRVGPRQPRAIPRPAVHPHRQQIDRAGPDDRGSVHREGGVPALVLGHQRAVEIDRRGVTHPEETDLDEPARPGAGRVEPDAVPGIAVTERRAGAVAAAVVTAEPSCVVQIPRQRNLGDRPAAIVEPRLHPAITRADVTGVEREPPAPAEVEIIPRLRDVSPHVERRNRLLILEHHGNAIDRAYRRARRLTPTGRHRPPVRHTATDYAGRSRRTRRGCRHRRPAIPGPAAHEPAAEA